MRRRHRTTFSDPGAAKAPDLVGRDVTADKPNAKYVGDITYLPIEGGKFCYLATVIDLASRRLAGWAIADHLRADLATDALAAAIRIRGNLAGSIMHTDHGAQAVRAGIRPSLRTPGRCCASAIRTNTWACPPRSPRSTSPAPAWDDSSVKDSPNNPDAANIRNGLSTLSDPQVLPSR